MTAKPVILRKRSDRDVEAAIAHNLSEAGEQDELSFIDALGRALRHIARHPATGSPRYAQELDLPGLRTWPLKRYPYLLFYVEQNDHLDVWRVLHAERDIPAWLREPGPGGAS